jgi:Na+/melibiose symporter-like transporter
MILAPLAVSFGWASSSLIGTHDMTHGPFAYQVYAAIAMIVTSTLFAVVMELMGLKKVNNQREEDEDDDDDRIESGGVTGWLTVFMIMGTSAVIVSSKTTTVGNRITRNNDTNSHMVLSMFPLKQCQDFKIAFCRQNFLFLPTLLVVLAF